MEKIEKKDISKYFSQISKKYDFLNHFFSMNIDKSWRKILLRKSNISVGENLLDLCSGTCDIAILFSKKISLNKTIASDICYDMLLYGEKKIKKEGLSTKIKTITADALKLPFKDETFDIVTMGFGLRNLPNYNKGLSEANRVLKKNGRILILDFVPPEKNFFGYLYKFYLNNIIPKLGKIISGSNIYDYLSYSIEEFLKPEEVIKTMSNNGFKDIYSKKLTCGISYIYKGIKY